MATWFLDLAGGSDANTGASFAQRMKTWNGIVGKAIAAGDEVRVMKTADPYSLGVNGTFTNGSNAVTLSAAVTADVDTAITAWTAGTGVTTTTTATGKIGATWATATIGGGYVNNTPVAYKTIGGGSGLDLSAYQQLNLWLWINAAVASGVFEIWLCSDTVGATPVYKFGLPNYLTSGWMQRCVIDYGSQLSSATAIKSVSLVKLSGATTPTIYLNNLFVSKAPGASDCLTLNHLVGKNTDPATGSTGVKEWFPIQSLSGTALVVGGGIQGHSGYPFSTVWTSETVALYAAPFLSAQAASTWSKSGSIAGGDITIQGGYDTTNMTSITGDTRWSMDQGSVNNMNCTATRTAWKNITFIAGTICLDMSSSAGFNSFTDCQFIGPYNTPIANPTGAHKNTFTRCFVIGGSATNGGPYIIGDNNTFSSCRFVYSALVASLSIYSQNNTFSSCFFSCGGVASVPGVLLQNNVSGFATNNVFRNCVFTGNAPDILQNATGNYLDNCSLASATEVTVGSFIGGNLAIFSTNHDQTVGNHQQWHDGGKIISDSTTRHTASGIAWKLSPTSTVRTSTYPLKTKIATVYCVSGVQTTVSAYFAKDHANISVGLRIIGGQLGGPASDTTQLSTCGTGSTYESTATQIQWTPTSTGWVEIEAICYTSSSTTSNGWVDDFGCVYG